VQSIEDFLWGEINRAPDRMAEERANAIFIRCPNPEHSGGHESTPSLRIFTDGSNAATFKCYGCGWTGHWNDIADILGLQRLNAATHVEKKFSALSQDDIGQMLGVGTELEVKVNPDEPLVLFERETPWYEDTDWRTIKGSTLKKVGALLVINRQGNCRIRFPAMYKGKRVGHVTGLLQKAANKQAPSYLESKHIFNGRPWSETHVLFHDYCREQLKKHPNKPLFIVEGPRDALKLIEYGLLAVPLLGTQKNLDEKIDTIFNLNPRCFIVMLDGDAAGRKGQKIIFKKLTRRYADVRRVKLPDDVDPAMLSKRIARKIERVRGR